MPACILRNAVILEFCDWGCLNKAISKGVFRPGLGNQAEGRLRYRAMLRTVREIVQVRAHPAALARWEPLACAFRSAQDIAGCMYAPVHGLFGQRRGWS